MDEFTLLTFPYAGEIAAARKSPKAKAAEIRDTKKAIRVAHEVRFFSK
jgi:hypothetical protein